MTFAVSFIKTSLQSVLDQVNQRSIKLTCIHNYIATDACCKRPGGMPSKG